MLREKSHPFGHGCYHILVISLDDVLSEVFGFILIRIYQADKIPTIENLYVLIKLLTSEF